MTSPAEKIRVRCPQCESEYDSWWRASISFDLDDFDDDELREATTATCPSCGQVVELSTLLVDGGVWTWRR